MNADPETMVLAILKPKSQFRIGDKETFILKGFNFLPYPVEIKVNAKNSGEDGK